MKDDAVYLQHILECIARIEEYTKGGHVEFTTSTLIQDGVVRNLQTLGQSVLKLSEPFKSTPALPGCVPPIKPIRTKSNSNPAQRTWYKFVA